MVSIPDWSRFRRGPPPSSPHQSSKTMTSRERYVRTMEKEAISEAFRKGYFLEPDKELIIDDFGETHEAEDPRTGLPMRKRMWHVNHIRYSHQHMRVLGEINMFTRITILILDHNFLESIDSLVACTELIKLDIHSNQISVLPDGIFWSQLQKLRILIAHDNPIVRVEVIHSLVACGRLQILTLYDSPLALKKNYRHHVVNTLWSLKALDRHVISDEEIIEDAIFKGTRFSSMTRLFEVELSPSFPKIGATFEEELVAIRILMRKVNRIMARYCPVLIIQKNIRFWLTYRRYRLYMDSRAWAAVIIQRAWRKYKNLPEPEQKKDLDSILAQNDWVAAITNKSASASHYHLGGKRSQMLTQAGGRQPSYIKGTERQLVSSASSLRRGKDKQGLIIDLQKLQQISSSREDTLNAAYIVAQAHMMSPKKLLGKVPGTRHIPDPPPSPARRPFIHQSHFLGPVMKGNNYLPNNHRNCLPELLPTNVQVTSQQLMKPEQQATSESLYKGYDEGEDVPKVAFRLEGKHQRAKHIDRFEDLVMTIKDHGQDVRDMETNAHDHIASMPVRTRTKRDAGLKNKFMQERIQQTMALSSLAAVQQAYRDRDLDERNAVKYQNILEQREQRELAKERIKAYHDEKRLLVMASRQDDKKLLKDVFVENDDQKTKQLKKSQSKRERRKAHKKRRESELKFAADFRTQQTSVSKALIKHDRQVQNDSKLQSKIEKVEGMKDMEREQQEIVKKYLQHRQLMRRSENTMARAALDTKLLQDANDRVFQAKSRVEQLKSRHDRAKQYTPIPQTAVTNPQFDLEGSANDLDNIANMRRKTSKSMFQFYVPSVTRENYRNQTRLTLSGGLSRLQTSYE